MKSFLPSDQCGQDIYHVSGDSQMPMRIASGTASCVSPYEPGNICSQFRLTSNPMRNRTCHRHPHSSGSGALYQRTSLRLLLVVGAFGALKIVLSKTRFPFSIKTVTAQERVTHLINQLFHTVFTKGKLPMHHQTKATLSWLQPYPPAFSEV